MNLNPQERALFLLMLESLDTLNRGIRIVARSHGALIALLRAKDVISAAEYAEAVNAHAAAREVDTALDSEEQERLERLEELKRMLREE